ncbi:MAG TPA: DUF362 domain-containing protein [Candidatus Cloacimonadota bacterium]|nr:DUF362 domain-containing protein [Candidatus Cloacimonadota bacterium]HQB40875.1 DUF362 domain-containing protein [Candidatus Cloacimonadota bacterium]
MAKVYFLTSRVHNRKSLLSRYEQFLKILNLPFIQEDKQILIKTHFGEDGNTAYLNPLYVRKTADWIKSKKALPFIGDSSTLYKGRRNKAISHLELALEHGFSYASVNAPLVILDGIKSDYYTNYEMNGKHFKEVQVAGALGAADGAVILSHVKGHGLAGMGAAVKNLAMGLANRTQKQRMHGDIKPKFKGDKCIGCHACIRICPVNAVTGKAKDIHIDLEKCIGCAECITHCPTQAMQLLWNETPSIMAEKMAETALAAVNVLGGRLIYMNFMLNITPNCDCDGAVDNPIVNDIGMLISEDPIAIDKASFDLVNKQKPLENSVIADTKGEIFKNAHPEIDTLRQLNYGAEIGLGSLEYELIEV